MNIDEYARKFMAREPERVVFKTDEIAEKLDELADICEYWKRQRGRGRTPSAIRAALLLLADELTLIRAAEKIPSSLY